MNLDTSQDLTNPQLAQLLGLASMTPFEQHDDLDKTSQLLRDRLSGPLPVKEGLAEQIPILLGKLQRGLFPGQGRSIEELLLDQNTPLEIIKTIKDYGKRLARNESSQSEHAVAIIIYYAAIASALLFYNQRITTHSFEYLKESFRQLTEHTCLPANISRHFAKTTKICNTRK